MNLTINGEAHAFETPLTVASLLERLDLVADKIAVERNLEIVPRSAYAATALSDGDTLEIVPFYWWRGAHADRRQAIGDRR